MATFAVVVSDPETGDSYQFEVDGQDANRFLGREIGDEVDGEAVGLDGYTVEITGGSDTAGRPMRGDVSGAALSDVLLAGGTGFDPDRDGERRRVTVRGREVGEEIVQLNLAVRERGEEPVAVLIGDADPEDFADDEDEEDADAADDAEESEADEDEAADDDAEADEDEAEDDAGADEDEDAAADEDDEE